MSSNTEENNNNATPNSNAAESPAKITKLNPSHVAKAKLLRQKLREKKKKEESVINSNNKSNGKSPEPSSPINTSNSSSNNNITIVKPETEKPRIFPQMKIILYHLMALKKKKMK